MTVERNPAGWSLWPGWLAATIFGFAIATAVILTVGDTLEDTLGDVVAVPVYGILFGVLVGTLQWLVLKQYMNRVGWWIPATLVGVALSAVVMAAYDAAVQPLGLGEPTRVVVGGVLVGAIVGISQWPVLRPHVSRAGWWVLASILGMALFAPVLSATEHLGIWDWQLFGPDKLFGYTVSYLVVFIFIAGLAGAVHGAATGIALLWLLRGSSRKNERG